MRLSFLFTVIIALAFCCRLNAQDAIGSWNIINAKITLSNKWSVFSEAQIRSLSFYNDFHYYEYKVAGTFNIDKNFSLTAGIGNYHTYSPGGNFKKPIVNDELRTWLQLVMNQNLDRIKIDHRYRIEQRWTTQGYRNRYRYRLNVVVPINKKAIEKNTVYVTAFDELFFTNQFPNFERNRLFIGAGYVLTKRITCQSGILNQQDYKLNEATGKNFLQLSFLFDIAAKNLKKENIQATID